MKPLLYTSLLGLVATLLVVAIGLGNGASATVQGASALPAVQQPLTAVSRLAAGYDHTCALLTNGIVKCWGANTSGQLGDGTMIYRSVAVPVLGLSGAATALTAGASHTCALIGNDKIQCWGDNWRGQLGNGSNDTSQRPVTVSGLAGNVTAVVAGGYHTCALAGGAVFCWGSNEYGQVGDGTEAHRATPTPVSGLESGVIALAAGMEHTCALRTTGAIFCWGRNQSGQLGNGVAGDEAKQNTPVAVNLDKIATAITAGREHTCARLQSGGVICWGANGEGQLGDGSTTMRATPVTVGNLTTGVTAIVAGGFHTCALQTTGATTAFCWGGNWRGALGNGAVNRSTPVEVLGLRAGVAALAAGGHHTCAVVDALSGRGSVQCWGENYKGQLGDGEALYRSQPTTVSNLPAPVTRVAAGGEHVCAVGTAKLSCWGLNWAGQLGLAASEISNMPVEVPNITTPNAVTTGSSHSCALTQQGGLYCWGWNSYGQLGNGSAAWQSTATLVAELATGVTAVDAGNVHTCALTQAGAAYCWGINWNGRLGDGTTDPRLTPTLVQGLPSALLTAIRTGKDHTCALTTDGAVFCWGANWYGQLGDGTLNERHKPVMVTGLSSDVTAIAVGATHSCALVNKPESASTVVCWGANSYGQLGNGTTVAHTQPVTVQGLPAAIQAITADGNHNCALTSGGGVVCWGANSYGQLGDGTTVDRLQPVAVTALADGVAALDAGSNHTCAVTGQGAVFCWGLDWAGQLGVGIQRWRNTPRDVVEEGPPATATPTTTPTYTPTSTPDVTVTVTPAPTRSSGAGDAFENDDNCTTAATLVANGTVQTHTFHQSTDVDWVRFDASANTTYRVEALIPDDSPADVDVELHESCDALPAKVWNATFAPGVRFDFKPVSNGSIFLRLDGQTDVGGDHVRYQLSVRPLAAQPQSGAVIIVAGRLKSNDPLQHNIHNVANRVYKLFQSQGYTNEDITYLATDSTLTGYDAAATKANLQDAITKWAVDKVGSNKALTLYLIDHGNADQFYLDGVQDAVITPTDLDEWLTKFENAVPTAKVNVIIEACYIGTFIALPNSISQPNRLIITSSDNNWSAYASPDGAHFSDHFLTALQQGRNLSTSFEEARRRVNRLFSYQNPWLDANGDNIPNQQADFDLAAQRGFAYAGTLDDNSWPPFIASATGPTAIINGHGLLTAEVRDDKGVERVWAIVYAPFYTPPTTREALIAETAPTLLFSPQGTDHYAIEYPAFTEPGVYRIVFYAKDSLGNVARPVEVAVTVGSGHLFLPLIRR
ncbi:MAG: C13 family peptidase [Caldilineaceae bacterium]